MTEVRSSKTIREGQYRDGQTRHGTTQANIHSQAKGRHYMHPEAQAHRARERSQPPQKY